MIFASLVLLGLKFGSVVEIPSVKGIPAPHPYAISGDGKTVIGQFAPGNPFIWRSGGEISKFRPNPDPDVLDHYAQAVSFDGSVIVGKSGSAYLWRKGFGAYLFDKRLDSFAYGVSADGSVVGGIIQERKGNVGFVWSKQSGLKRIGGFSPTAVSADGKALCGIAINKGETYAFDWKGGFAQPLPTDDDVTDSSAYGLSKDGEVVVGSVTTKKATLAAVWKNGKLSRLANLGSADCTAKCVTYDGDYIGGYAGKSAAIWEASGKGVLLSTALGSVGSAWSFESINGIAKIGNKVYVTGWGRFKGKDTGYWANFVAQ